jgi:hypothetical protein
MDNRRSEGYYGNTTIMTRITEEYDKLVVKNGNDWTYVHAGYTIDFEFNDYDHADNDTQIAVKDSDNKLTAILWIENSAAKELIACCEENNINHKVTY